MNRVGELGDLPPRNKRLFERNGYWYYSTREGVDIGPFDTQAEASHGVSAYIDFVLHAEPQVVEALKVYRTAA